MFLVSMHTKIMTLTENIYANGIWTFIVSVFWIFLMRKVVIADAYTHIVWYALGTSVGCVFSTKVYPKLKEMFSSIKW
jgi:hypothetical protein